MTNIDRYIAYVLIAAFATAFVIEFFIPFASDIFSKFSAQDASHWFPSHDS